jgi:acetyl-CoA carboxylase biotin carboxylase subunit
MDPVSTPICKGYKVVPYYDSLVGKLIVASDNRTKSIMKLQQALNRVVIEGISTTIPMHKALSRDQELVDGPVNTGWLEVWIADQRAQV